ncbi:ABC transporter permease [Gilliamella sp. wkB108]|uniref:FecCD family ABC transporter permease n=1 Tax=Gilliamella sp. wkB108 TaxID=3120256 RepID=UPI00080DB54C|nr:iron ABC transporter permease [Gilliamella apicola]OCG23947.1 ABC transporter permease [Gilliamella apicola]
MTLLSHQRILIGLIVITIGLALFSLFLGHYSISINQIFKVLYSPFIESQDHLFTFQQQIIWQVRIPRILLAFLAGSGLALCGAVLQGLFYNPLVDPHVIGVTSSAAFGGTLAILLDYSTFGLIVLAFLFGISTLLLIFILIHSLKQNNILILVLVGLVLSGFFSALVSLMQYLADTEEKLPSIVFWLLGSFATANWHKLIILAIPTIIASYLLIRLSWRINLLSLGDNEVKSLGISVLFSRWLILVLCTLIISIQVAVSGCIGWVGLIIPHAARLLVGGNHQRLLPIAFWLGGGFMIIIDDIARIISTSEIPLGIITALIGAPCFVLLLRQQILPRS